MTHCAKLGFTLDVAVAVAVAVSAVIIVSAAAGHYCYCCCVVEEMFLCCLFLSGALTNVI